jgi:hypothetical protein
MDYGGGYSPEKIYNDSHQFVWQYTNALIKPFIKTMFPRLKYAEMHVLCTKK